MRYLVFGNSGSGKSTLAKKLAATGRLAHLDLDTVAWLPQTPPRRRAVSDSLPDIHAFARAAPAGWVIEGCYADLVEATLPLCDCLVFLNPGAEACVANALDRPWEPHKYASKEAQDANLAMLVGWIRDYDKRDDPMSLRAHRAVFERFSGRKVELVTRSEIAAFDGCEAPGDLRD